MKLKAFLAILIITVTAAGLWPGAVTASADSEAPGGINYNVPYATWTLGPEGSVVTTQTAFVPLGKYSSEAAPLKAPQDMAYGGGKLYIADTGNKRVAVISAQSGELIASVGDGFLKEPAGVTVSSEKLYVADRGSGAVSVFSLADYSHITDITKPDNPLVGANTPYVPVKLAVDGRGNMYIVSEGCVNGLMQLNPDGGFVGYVGANETNVTVWDNIRSFFFSQQQRQTFLKTPRSPNNVAINRQGLLFTVTGGAAANAVKKLNTLGSVIMSPSFSAEDTVAVCLDAHDNIYTVTSGGTVIIFDGLGNLLFAFGEKDITSERLGVLDSPTALAVTDDGRLMVLDSKYNMVVLYAPTDYTRLLYGAVDYYKDGLYLEGEPLWQEALRLNSNFIVAYSALAQADMKRGDYASALSRFQLAENRTGYSDAFWQIRNGWLQKYLGWVLLALIAVIALIVIYSVLKKRGSRAVLPITRLTKKISAVTIINRLFFIRKFALAPRDSVYEIKTRKRAGVLSASILYLWFIALQILNVFVTGYLFSGATVYNTNALQLILTSILPLALWTVCNYFVSTVTGGEGKFKECYIITIYSMMPYLVFALPLFIISNLLTLNEAVIYNLITGVMYAYTGVIMFLSLSELHDFSFWQTVKNVLLTLLTAALVVLAAVILRMLFGQLFGYITEVFREVFIL